MWNRLSSTKSSPFFVYYFLLTSSLGVHISFVRSIAMDSWTDAQLKLMKTGGNDKCNAYLQSHGIGPRTPIKQKYESPAAQLYKEVLKARAEGRPEPTELPKPVPRKTTTPTPVGGSDPNGMERLVGETDQQYIARQTRLREEAKARMAAKFGNSGGMGGVGSGGGSRMAGIGSDPNYNPNGGYGGGGGGVDMDSFVSGFGNALSSVGQSVSNMMQDESVQNLKSKGGSFWSQFASSVSSAASSITQPDEDDGLAALQRSVAQQKPTKSVYSGFGSDSMGAGNAGGSSFGGTNSSPSSGASGLQEATGLPGEDRNGIERLTGESDEQYVMRQTRLREEARARMAAKFGNGGGMGGVGSSSMGGGGGFGSSGPSSTSSYSTARMNTVSAPSSGNAPSFATGPAGIRSAPVSGNAPRTSPPKKEINSSDFFSSFGA